MIQEYKSFEAEGVIEQMTDEQGTSERGTAWHNISFLLNTGGRDQIKLPITVGSRHIDKFAGLCDGMEARVTFDISPRAYTDKNGTQRYDIKLYAWNLCAPGQEQTYDHVAAALDHQYQTR